MKTAGNIGIVAVVLVCLGALALSVYPGVLNDILLFALVLSVFAAPLIAIIGAFTLWWLDRRGRLGSETIPWRQVRIALLVLLGTTVLLIGNVPRRIAFMASRSAFQSVVDQAPIPVGRDTLLNRRLGIYMVDEYRADSRGGTYFRVYSSPDSIDTISFGFCYRPNSEGSPFGASGYRTFRLGDGWYWFRANNDW